MTRSNPRVALVGQPNVGKSVIMNLLTGAGAVVSNYPGTTVEVTEADWVLNDEDLGLVKRGKAYRFSEGYPKIRFTDTPGVYTLHSDTDEQKVTQRVLLERDVDLIVDVVDARALDRNLYLTYQLLDLHIPLVVALNQMDLAEEIGLHVDPEKLSDALGVPVVPLVASKGVGLGSLKRQILEVVLQVPATHQVAVGETVGSSERIVGSVTYGRPMVFSEPVERAIGLLADRVAAFVPAHSVRARTFPPRALAIHLLERDELHEDLFQLYPWLHRTVEAFQKDLAQGRPECSVCFRGCSLCPRAEGNPPFLTCTERSTQAREVARHTTVRTVPAKVGFRGRLEAALDAPMPGIPLQLGVVAASLLLVRYFMDYAEMGIEWFVGLVTEGLVAIVSKLAPGAAVLFFVEAFMDSVLVPFSVVMPAMLSIYVVMALLEDSGLLPRISVSLDRAMSAFGLPGHSTIPIMLGFGCKAPAILATRTLGDDRSRRVVSALIAITVPCAASFAIITGTVEHFGASLLAVYGSMIGVFLLLGLVMGRMSSGGEPLVLEIPPVRFPVLSNVWEKVKMRVSGFFREVLPILVVTGVVVAVLVESGVLSRIAVIDPVTRGMFGIGGQPIVAVLVSVVQRYMAPMVLLNLPLTAREATIATAMVSVSMPCLPVSVLMKREFGGKFLLKVFGLAMALSAGVGIVLNLILPAM